MRALLSPRRTQLVSAIDACLVPASASRRVGRLLAHGATACGLILGCAASALAAVYTVDTTGDPGPGGTTSLRQAVFEANGSDGNVIAFDPGLDGNTITLLNGELAISTSTYVAGPGPDNLTIDAGNNSRIFDVQASAASPPSVEVTGLKLIGGNALLGGAIYSKDTSLTLRDATITGSTAIVGGGLDLYSDAGHATTSVLTNVTIEGNSAFQGGGLYAGGGAQLTATHLVIASNTGSGGGGCCGGASFSKAGTVTLQDAEISGNSATATANVGGLGVLYSLLQLQDSTLSGNSAAGDAGGLFVYAASASLVASHVTGNAAENGGGILVSDRTAGLVATLSLFDSTVSGNRAIALHAFGGGIDIKRAVALNMYRTLVSGNNAYNYSGGGGGGIALQYTYSKNFIRDSTIYGNYAYDNGGGIGIFDTNTGIFTYLVSSTIAHNVTFDSLSDGIVAAGTPSLDSCIVAYNAGHSSQDLYGSFDSSYSLIRTPGTANVVGGGNITGQDPQLGPLAVNGGPTPTLLPAVASPALDAGDPMSVLGSDQRGLPRVVNARADMGAVERQYPEEIIFRNGFDSS